MRVKKRILFFCIVVLSMLVFCEIGSAKLKKVSKKIIVVYEEKNGVIEKVNIAKRIIWIYDLNRNKRIRYKLSKKCKIINVKIVSTYACSPFLYPRIISFKKNLSF